MGAVKSDGTNAADGSGSGCFGAAFNVSESKELFMRAARNIVLIAAVVATGAVLSAYGQGYTRDAPPPPQYYGNTQAAGVQYGVVDGIDYVQHGSAPSGVGAVVGGVAGGVIGHQIGSGRGNTAATIAGAIGGALVGNEVENRNRRADEDYRIGVRMDDGSYRTFVLPDNLGLRAGDRVAVEGGRIYRQ
jgi:outer membrane lipoprotein SlyB